VQTGQSNPYGYETATVNFPLNTRVFDFETSGYTLATQSTNPASGFSWANPDPSAAAVTENTTVPSVYYPYVGYRRGSTGNQGMAMANALQVATGRDVYIVSICLGGAPISLWETGGSIKALLESFVPYILANTPALAGMAGPDIVLWGQSETNAIPTDPAFKQPLAYKDAWLAVRTSSYGLWSDLTTSRWFITEATQAANWTSTNTGYPWRWEGLNAVDRYTDEKVRLVSSIGLEVGTGSPVFEVHYTGNGNNQYGERLAKVALGITPAQGMQSQELRRELQPVLGGTLDANSKAITSIANISLVGAATTYTAAADPVIAALASHTYDFASANPPSLIKYAGTHTLANTGAVLGNSVFDIQPIITNITGEANVISAWSTLYLAVGFVSAGQTVTMGAENDIVSAPSFSATGGGLLGVTAQTGFYSAPSVGQGATLTSRVAFSAGPPALSGTGAVTKQAGFASWIGTGATNSTHVLMGTNTIPTGNYGVYQSTAQANRWNGSHYLKYVTKTAAYTASSATDHIIHFTSGTGNLTLPAITAANQGWQVIVRNDRATTVNITVTGSDAIGPAVNVAAGGCSCWVSNGVAGTGTWWQLW
jgi:hypothetical protein